jgi:hypothetical protein
METVPGDAMDIIKKRLYIYTRKVARIEKIYQHYELIPKLFYNKDIYKLQENPNDVTGRELFSGLYTDIILNFKKKHPRMKINASNIYYFLFFEYEDESKHLTKIKTDYLKEEDKNKIWTLIDYVLQDTYNTRDELVLFIEHLMRGHEEMQFGLYFSFKLIKDDNYFLDKQLQLVEDNPSFDMINYMKAEDFFNYIAYLKESLKFTSPLLYVNSGWQYGKKDENSVVFNTDIEKFKSALYNKILKQEFDIEQIELICQVPLHFNTLIALPIGKKVYFDQKYLKYEQKYLKYKQKYLKLKAKII